MALSPNTSFVQRAVKKKPYFARFRVSVCIGDFMSIFSSWMCSFVEKKKGGSGDNVRVHFVDDALPLALVIRKLFQL